MCGGSLRTLSFPDVGTVVGAVPQYREVVHDLRSPLSTVVEGIDELMRLDSDVQAARMFDHIRRAIKWMAVVVEAPGRLLIDREPVDVREVVADVEHLMRAPMMRRGQTLVIVEAGTPRPVHADRVALSRLLLNLFDNASKYGRTADSLRLEISYGTRRALLRVVDHGPGMTPAERASVFRPFYRGSAARASGVAGTGLGLTVSREIAVAHRGNIGVARRDHATVAWVTLPYDAPSGTEVLEA